MRCRAAKSRLARWDIAATEVAYLPGFAEQSSFNRAFQRWAGLNQGDTRNDVVVMAGLRFIRR
jgi:AraC-like DNA-binding protein